MSIFCLATNAVSGPLPSSDEFWRSARIKTETLLRFEQRLRTENESGQLEVSTNAGERSVGKAVLLSAAIPGAGQAYNKSYLKSAAFMLVEALSIVGYVHFRDENQKLEREFEAYGDLNWNEKEYWDWIHNEAETELGAPLERGTDIPAAGSELRNWERARFSHSLPTRINQQWYENIGKYDQFIIGWYDFREETVVDSIPFTYASHQSTKYRGQDLKTISPLRTEYTLMRRDANDQYKRATNLLSLLIFNHVGSAIEAGLSARRHNGNLGRRMQLDFFGMFYMDHVIPALSVKMKW